MKYIRNIFLFGLSFIIYILLWPIGKVIYSRKKPWLFCERGFDANDNSYYFLKWIRENKKQINCYYIINKKAFNYNEIKSLCKVVRFGSFKHWLIFIGSRVRLSTHLNSYVPNQHLIRFFINYKKSGLDVFLQHGITHNFQDCFYKINNNSDLIVCGAQSEYDYLLKNYDLSSESLIFCGFPRFDFLLKNDIKTEKSILIMPTWRRYLFGLSTHDFIKSDYFINWMNLLNDEKLIKLCGEKQIKILFNIHPSFSSCAGSFVDNCKNKSVFFVKNDENIQTLFKKSSLLITDYSSILFDYALLKKPTIYFQFDQADFYNKQYNHGFFYIDKNGFGDVFLDVDSVVKKISYYSLSNFELENLYKNRIVDFFGENINSCQKLFGVIEEKLK